jgi:hypothetical protein
MAGEYSREFSARVFNGQSRRIELGFRRRSGGIRMEFLRPTGVLGNKPEATPSWIQEPSNWPLNERRRQILVGQLHAPKFNGDRQHSGELAV